MSSLLGFQDFMATGSVDLFETFEDQMYNRTQVGLVDRTGLVNTSHGRHLYAWDPPASREEFANSAHASVCNTFAIRGLEALGDMADAAGRTANATKYKQQAASMKSAFLAQLGDEGAQHFCDGPCTDPAVDHHGGVVTNYFTLFNGLVPARWVDNVWRELARHGLREIGDYGSHIFLNALASHEGGDNGTAMFHALTKCDDWSWCKEIQELNATMTRETLNFNSTNGQTMSHPWGTGALSGIVRGIVGVQQTGVAWKHFTVRPALATLSFVSATVPTIRGPIVVNASRHRLSVSVPCNTKATLCLQQQLGEEDTHSTILLDGFPVSVHRTSQHLCTPNPIGCASGARVLTRTRMEKKSSEGL